MSTTLVVGSCGILIARVCSLYIFDAAIEFDLKMLLVEQGPFGRTNPDLDLSMGFRSLACTITWLCTVIPRVPTFFTNKAVHSMSV